MSNKVITTMRIDFDLLKAAQARCAERGESVTAVCTRALEAYVADDAPGVPAPAKLRRRGTAAPAPSSGPPMSSLPPAGPRVSAGTAAAVFQPAGAEPVTGAPVPAIRRASDITPPPRCQHKGTRITGGWCVPCQADVKPGGKLPANWVMPEGWSAS